MKKIVSFALVLMLCLSLCACGKAGDYESAITLMEAGSYEEAIAAFAELGDYEDSIQKLEECENILAYAEAVAFFETKQYENAFDIFTTLGNYQDSMEKKLECEKALAYQNAIDLIASGDYENAYISLIALGDYKDVSEILTHFRKVEITTENWNDYFNVSTEIDYIKNDFDEITNIRFVYVLVLNDDKAGCIFNPTESNVIFEFRFTKFPKNIEFDKTSGDYKVNAPMYTHTIEEETATLTWKLQDYSVIYSNDWTGLGPGAWDWNLAENFEAIRAKGSIFIYE